MANNQKRERNRNIHSTTKVCDTATTPTREKTHNETTNSRRERHSPSGSQLSLRSGTATSIEIDFPIVGSREWAEHIRGIDKYKLAKNKERLVRQYLRDVEREFQTDKNMDRNRKRKSNANESADDYDGGSYSSDKRSKIEHTGFNRRFSDNLEIKKKVYNTGTRSRRERRESITPAEGPTESLYEFSDSDIEQYIIENSSDNKCEKEKTNGTTPVERGREHIRRNINTGGPKEHFGYTAEEKKYK